MLQVHEIKKKYELLSKLMDERMRRLWAASEAEAIGWGGISAISEATGLSRTTITAATKELKVLEEGGEPLKIKIRRGGGGRKKLKVIDPKIIKELEELIEPYIPYSG